MTCLKRLTFLCLLLCVKSLSTSAQNTRINDYNTIGWFTNNTTIKFNSKWSVHLEYQWRREHIVTSWQQSLFRTGINYQANNKLLVRVGYAFAGTYNYGDYPLQAAGKYFPENRAFEMVTLSDNSGRIETSHRFMLEQRWIGRYTDPMLEKTDATTFVNRFRYMYRMQMALGKKKIVDKTPYAAIYDEVAIGFGKNVNANVFDQNRLGIIIGYRFNRTFRLEGGYLSQIVQLGRLINNRNVFQYNSGIILNTYINLDFSKG